jgi:hypothetical protein
MSKRAAAANEIISADEGRYYDLVDGLDGLTFAFGNWPQQEAEGFFADMAKANGGKALNSLEGCLSQFFSSRGGKAPWAKLEATAKAKPADPTAAAVDAALKSTILNHVWMERYSNHCKVDCAKGEANFYKEQSDWFTASMHYALRDRDVIQWQVDFWDRTTVANAVTMASTAGMGDDLTAIIDFTPFASSAPARANPVTVAAKANSKLTFGSYVWNWGTPPKDAPTDATGLARWHYAVIWQYYVEYTRQDELGRAPKDKKPPLWSFRPRSRRFYDLYLKAYWVMPALDAKGEPVWTSDKNLDPSLIKARKG